MALPTNRGPKTNPTRRRAQVGRAGRRFTAIDIDYLVSISRQQVRLMRSWCPEGLSSRSTYLIGSVGACLEFPHSCLGYSSTSASNPAFRHGSAAPDTKHTLGATIARYNERGRYTGHGETALPERRQEGVCASTRRTMCSSRWRTEPVEWGRPHAPRGRKTDTRGGTRGWRQGRTARPQQIRWRRGQSESGMHLFLTRAAVAV